MSKDYYEILGLGKNATQDDIAKAYKKLAFKYHPDRNKDDKASQKFKDIAEAYEILGDKSKRRHYDQFGTTGPSVDPSGFDIDPFQFFDDIFGFGRQFNRRKSKGADILIKIEITLAESYNGCKKNVNVKRRSFCRSCDGRGGEHTHCQYCGGSGSIAAKQGFFQVSIPCKKCGGKGEFVISTCEKCNGDGTVVSEEEKVAVQIPPGVVTGSEVKVRGAGENNFAGAETNNRGDLIVLIRVLPHSFYKRDNRGNLHCVLPITYSQAVLGDTVKIPVLSGKKCEVKIPKGISSGDILRIKNEGMPHGNGNMYGNIYVQVNIEPIISEDKEYLELIDKLKKFEKNNIPEKIKKFNEKIKKM